jgi:hypothetical protein
MCVKFVSAAVTVVALAAAPVLVSASDNPLPSANGKSAQSTTVEKSTTRFAALKGVKAVPMAAKELDAVKGLHVHFFTPSKNVVDTPFGPLEGIHLAGDIKTENNWSNLYGQGDVANSYHGLCGAAVNGSAIFINPGGGCGF